MSVPKAIELQVDFARQCGILVTWIVAHRNLFTNQFRVYFYTGGTALYTDEQIYQQVFRDVWMHIIAGPDDLYWNYSWRDNFIRRAFPQTKKRLRGLFIKARKTRGNKRNFLYVRVPHR